MFTSIMLLDYLKLTTKIWILNLKKPIIFICLTQYTYMFTLISLSSPLIGRNIQGQF